MAAGCMPKVAAKVVTEIYAAAFADGRSTAPPDAAAERRRKWDRERKAMQKREVARVESGGNRVEKTDIQKLWSDGVALLRQLGVAEKAARGNVGRWLKAGNEPARIFNLIADAHAKGIGDPVPWVTVGLGAQQNGKPSRRKSLSDAADDLIARTEGFSLADDPGPAVHARSGVQGR